MPQVKRDAVPIHTPALRAARWAVFTPCCGTRWKQRSFEETAKHVQWLWRKQLAGLADVGTPWLDPQRHDAEQTLATKQACPVFGIRAPGRLQVCNRPKICPFCYARQYVLHAVVGLEKVMTHPKVKRTDTIIVDYTMTMRFTHLSGNHHWQSMADMRDEVWDCVVATAKEGKRNEIRQLDTFGGYLLHRVHFDNNEWKLLRSGVFLCPRKTYNLRGIVHDECESPRVTPSEMTTENLSRAVGRAFRYPENNLITAPEIVREYVARFRGNRAIESYGLCRKFQ